MAHDTLQCSVSTMDKEAHLPPIDEFLEWIHKNDSVKESDSDGRAAFFSIGDLAGSFEENNGLGRMLKELFDPSFNYTAIFCILLELGKGSTIQHLIENELDDEHLPFNLESVPPRFPLHDGTFYQHFCEKQWRFSAPDFQKSIQQCDDNTILPIITKTPINKGGSATVFRIQIHGSYNSLHGHELPAKNDPNSHLFALKSYSTFDHLKFYKTEVDAFEKLKRKSPPEHNPENGVQERILAWLQNGNGSSRRHEETGKWLLAQCYEKRSRDNDGFLWIKGIKGTGKSLLESPAFEDIRRLIGKIADVNQDTSEGICERDNIDKDGLNSRAESSRNWLSFGDGIYWVAKKPDSGKWVLVEYFSDSSSYLAFQEEVSLNPMNSYIITFVVDDIEANVNNYASWLSNYFEGRRKTHTGNREKERLTFISSTIGGQLLQPLLGESQTSLKDRWLFDSTWGIWLWETGKRLTWVKKENLASYIASNNPQRKSLVDRAPSFWCFKLSRKLRTLGEIVLPLISGLCVIPIGNYQRPDTVHKRSMPYNLQFKPNDNSTLSSIVITWLTDPSITAFMFSCLTYGVLAMTYYNINDHHKHQQGFLVTGLVVGTLVSTSLRHQYTNLNVVTTVMPASMTLALTLSAMAHWIMGIKWHTEDAKICYIVERWVRKFGAMGRQNSH